MSAINAAAGRLTLRRRLVLSQRGSGWLVALALFGSGLDQLDWLRQLPSHLLFDHFQKRNVGGSQVGGIRHQGPTQAARARGELADAPGNQVYQNVGIANLLQCLFAKFSVQSLVWIVN